MTIPTTGPLGHDLMVSGGVCCGYLVVEGKGGSNMMMMMMMMMIFSCHVHVHEHVQGLEVEGSGAALYVQMVCGTSNDIGIKLDRSKMPRT